MLTILLAFVALGALVPVPTKSTSIKRLLLGLHVLAVVALFLSLAPNKVWESAPFHKYPPAEIALNSCSLHLFGHQFCPSSDPDSQDTIACACTNFNALATISHCYDVAYPKEMATFISTCNTKYGANLTAEKVQMALAAYDNYAKLLAEDSEISAHPLRLNDSRIITYKNAYDQFLGNYNRSINYGFYELAFFGALFLVISIVNWSKILCPSLVNRLHGRVSNSIRAHLTVPALSGPNKTNETQLWAVLDYLAPTRFETLILTAFFALVAYLLVTNIHYVQGDPFYAQKTRALGRYVGVRSGILASYLLPLSVLFAGRNNILQWITRWEYATFVMLHRWILRVMVLLIIVHAHGYYLAMSGEKRSVELSKFYMWAGIAGFYAGIAILIQGLLVLRRRWYEVFLILHIALALLFIVGAWFHVKDLYFLAYYYCSLGLWALDRAVRVHRILQFGFPKACVEWHADNTLLFKVKKPANFEAEGGGHCFVHFLQWWCCWQSHPFTYTIMDNDLVFYVKVKDGVTKQLAKSLETSKRASIRLAIEGSYGEATPASKFDSAIFVAGGNGMPGIYAEAVQMERHQNQFSNQKIKLIWVIRDHTSLSWFYKELCALRSLNIDAVIYFTRPGAVVPTETSALLLADDLTSEQMKKNLDFVTFIDGRPDIAKVVRSGIEESPGSACFVTCGHPKMVDDIRAEVAANIAFLTQRIDFFEQLQVWA